MLKTAAVIAEFNPFHNGHKYLLSEAKRKYADRVMVIMSGSFVQRGDIAITDKWTRAEAALKNGADLVIELPVTFSMNTAQKFAYGAVATLNAAGIADTLVFGSESGDIEALTKAARIIANEPPELSDKIKQLMAQGLSFPLSRSNTLKELTNSSVLDYPNDILGVEYIRAIIETGSSMTAAAVTRLGTEHDSEQKTKDMASASEIRKMICSGADISDYTPSGNSFNIYDPDVLSAALIAKIRSSSPEQLRNINDVAEGLENRFIKAASECYSFSELCMAVKSKRYTLSRIRRIAWSILLDLDKEICSLKPSYIRILGMNDTGKAMLRDMKKTASLPVITKPSDYPGDAVFNKNRLAEDLFALCSRDPKRRTGGSDLRTSPVIA